jgi:hypothetical protein
MPKIQAFLGQMLGIKSKDEAKATSQSILAL